MENIEIIQINQNTWRIEDHGVRFFLLTGTEKALLIDSGMNVHNAKDLAESLTKLPVSLLNTHSDRDHIGSNGQFERFYMHPAEQTHYREGGGTGELIPVVDGDIIDLGCRKLKIIHLPGHTPGSIAALDIDSRVLISGDPIQEHGRIFMFGTHRNMGDYIGSLEHLEQFRGEFDEIWPSHADIPVSPDLIRKLYDGAIDIYEGKYTGSCIDMFGRQAVLYDLGFTAFLCDK